MRTARHPSKVPQVREQHLVIPCGGVLLPADLALPAGAGGLVVFAHGSGSSRKSARNRFVAQSLRECGLGTLLFDLLTASEEQRDALDSQLRFDIPFLASRLGEVTDWLGRSGLTTSLPVGYFGASTGAAAALMAAAERHREIGAVVSRGGRADLAGNALTRARAPTLLIVGSQDESVLGVNRDAFELLPGPKRLSIVAGASHLFEETGALEQVAQLASDWFVEHLSGGRGDL